jgi:predicted unusual protein kinase regulating ubiquinone biosynthesis (AarF/ABC1/UbiB family)
MTKHDQSFPSKKPPNIHRIKSGSFSRGMSLTTLGLKAGARFGTYSLTGFLTRGDKKQARRQQMLEQQAQLFAEELGKLKGSVMKVGQVLALYGEHLFLPPEVVDVLRTLQDDSPPLQWKTLLPILQRELDSQRLQELDMDPTPLAAASLGQVHRARRKRDGKALCIKIQYPGVAESVDSDLNTLQTLLLFSRLLPRGLDISDFMIEVREMLHREVDYDLELKNVERFRQLLKDDGRFCIPETFPEYSTKRVLTTTFESGLPVSNATAKTLSQQQRNQLGAAALELFLREFFQWNWIQTDPNFGNYRIRLDPKGDRLVLLDFGSVRRFSEAFLAAYREMVRGAFWRDKERLWKAAIELNFMPANASPATLERFAELCFLIMEPFAEPGERPSVANLTNSNGEYCWRTSNLPQRVALAASKASLSLSFRLPPREFIFLHRKLGGVFLFLAELGAELNTRHLLLPYMGQPKASSDSKLICQDEPDTSPSTVELA